MLTVGQTLTVTVLIENSGATVLTRLPLSYTFDSRGLHLLAAAPAPLRVGNGIAEWEGLTGAGGLLPGDRIGVQLAFAVIGSSQGQGDGLSRGRAIVTGAADLYGQPAPATETELPLRLTAPAVGVEKGLLSNPAGIGLGSLVTYTVAIANRGDTRLVRVGVQDAYEPAYLRFISATVGPPAIHALGTNSLLVWEDVTAALGDVEPGAVISFTALFLVEGAGRETTNRVGLFGVEDVYGDRVAPVAGEFGLTAKIAALGLEVSSEPGAGAGVQGGEPITYTVRVSNTGGVDLTGVWLRTEIPTNTDYLAGSAQPPVEESRALSGDLAWAVGALGQGEAFTARFVVVVKVGEQGGVVVSRAAATSEQTPVSRRAVIVHTALPTAVELLRFTARGGGEGVWVEWETGWERETWGFHLWRSEDENFAHSQMVTGWLIPATGGNGGAVYGFVDRAAAPGGVYWYWLEEVETDGERIFYGPVRSLPGAMLEGDYRLFLPAVAR